MTTLAPPATSRRTRVQHGEGDSPTSSASSALVSLARRSRARRSRQQPSTAAQALEAGTSINARLLGLTRMGTVAAGKEASFVVLSANPLASLRNE